MIGEMRQTVHPPFRAHLPAGGEVFEHLVDGELEAQITATAEVPEVEQSVDDVPLPDGRAVDFLNELLRLHPEGPVQ